MTTAMAIEDAGAKLPQLVERAEHGQQVVLTRDGRPVARIVALGGRGVRPKAGFGKGTVRHMAEDFDASLGGQNAIPAPQGAAGCSHG